MNYTRRSLVKKSLLTLAALPLLGRFISSSAQACTPAAEPLATADKLAPVGQLGYIVKSNQPGKVCGNCMFYGDGKVKNAMKTGCPPAHAKCNMLQNKYVSVYGYCTKYAPFKASTFKA